MPLVQLAQNETVADQIERNRTFLGQQELDQMEQGEEAALIGAGRMVPDEFVPGQACLLKVSVPSVEGVVEVKKSWIQPGLG